MAVPEITVVIGESVLNNLLKELNETKKRGDSSAVVEYENINFQVYVEDSKRLRALEEKRPR